MTIKTIADLTTLTPLATDLVVLDRPTDGAGAPVTGKTTLAGLQALIDTGITDITVNSPLSSSGGTTPTVSLGTVGVANGGTGLTSAPANGQLLIGSGSAFSLSTLTAGSGISITNDAGSVTIASTGGGGGGGSTAFTGALTVYVDAVSGSDAPGRGTLSAPYQTINYAYSQVPSLGNPSNTLYDSNVGKFITEKLIFRLAPGRYTGDVTLGFKRARVQLIGNGVQIVGNVKMSVKLADFPASNMEALKASFPFPWTSASSQNTFEITGEAGGGVEADASADPFVVTGLTSLAFEESAVLGFGALGAQVSWESHFGTFYYYANKAALIGGMVMATNYTDPTVKGVCTSVIEVDSCTIGESASPIRTYFGVVPYAYLSAASTWSTANNGTTNKAPVGTVTLKCHNSTLGAALGPRLTIGEIDGCRLYDIDRTMLGTVDNGGVVGSTSTSYIGMVVNQFRVYSGAGIPASQYQLGAASGTTRYKMDSTSYTTLAFSRNSSGVLSTRTLNLGGGVSFDFLDEARSFGYVPTTGANWTAPAPTTVQSALDRLASAVFALRGNSSIP